MLSPRFSFLLCLLPLAASAQISTSESVARPLAVRAVEQPNAFLIELAAEPTAVVYAQNRAAAKGGSVEAIANSAAVAQLAVVEAQQRPWIAALRSGDIRGTYLFDVQRVANGIAAEMTADEAARVAAMPGVRRVVPLATLKPLLSASATLIGAPSFWNPSSGIGLRGEGVRIGVIDSGIDYLHVDLGGAGVYSRTNFTTADVPWNAKVVGGVDLAGDDYDAGSSDPAKRTPKPDADPMDCSGHGTHVAGIIAGVGVKSDGTAFTADYPSTIDPAAFRIGPGVAPAAKLYAIRVFGCSGSTKLVVQALDWALDPNRDGDFSDRLDVVNLSLGTPYGGGDTAESIAADNAAAAGLIVVAASGNDGDTQYITASPAAATRALSVAASADSTDTVDAFEVTAPASIAGSKGALPSNAFNWTAMTAAVTGSVAYPPTQRSGCAAFTSANASLLSGNVALLDWTDDACGSAARVRNAAAAGAIGVLFAYDHARIDITIAGSKEIPAMITTQTTADAIKGALPVTVRFDASLLGKGINRLVDASVEDTLADFSSRGPRLGDSLLKPELSAPGETIFSAKNRSGNLGTSENGTSMAAPHVAGAMALLKQLHPDWSVEELKALAINSATSNVYATANQQNPICAPQAAGVGRLSLADARITDVLAYAVDTPGSVGVSFGFVEVPGQVSVERRFRVANKSATAAVVTLEYVPIVDVPGVRFDFPDGAQLSIPANGSVVAKVRLTATAAQMKHRRDPALADKQLGYPRYWQTEAAGYINLMRGFEPLRLPVYAIVRPSSTMTAAATPIDAKSASGHVSVALSGNSVETGTEYPNDWVSLVSPFELQEAHPRNAAIPAAQNLRYVGVTSDYQARSASLDNTMIYIGVATWGPWTTPGETYAEIRIDTTGDARSDSVLFTSNASDFLGVDSFDDVFISGICPMPFPNLPSATCSSQYLNGLDGGNADVPPFNTDVVRFAFSAKQIGLVAGKSQFRYRVITYKRDLSVGDYTDWLTFDPAHSLNLFANVPIGLFFDRASNRLWVDWSSRDDTRSASGLLLLHYFNAAGTRAEVVPILTGAKHRAAAH